MGEQDLMSLTPLAARRFQPQEGVLMPQQQGMSSLAPQPQPPQAQSSGFDPGIWASILGGQGADIASTQYARSRGMQEGNPMMGSGSFGRIAPTKLGLGAGLAYGASKLKASHPKLSRGLQIAGTAMGAVPATLNMINASRQR